MNTCISIFVKVPLIFVFIGCHNMCFKNFHHEFLKILFENALFVNVTGKHVNVHSRLD